MSVEVRDVYGVVLADSGSLLSMADAIFSLNELVIAIVAMFGRTDLSVLWRSLWET
jgi:hypothetical protein